MYIYKKKKTQGNLNLSDNSSFCLIFGSLLYFITKCDRYYYRMKQLFYFTKCHKSLLQNMLGFSLQIVTVIPKRVEFVAFDSY